MKMLIIIVQDQDSYALIDDIIDKGLRVTKLSSTGGFLKQGNTTLLMGIEEDKIDTVYDLVETHCKTRKIDESYLTINVPGETYIPYPLMIEVGGATIFVLDVVDFIRI